MFDPQIISLGPVFLPLSLIALVVILFASVWLAERLSPARELVKGTLSDWLPTALLVALLVYKFGPALLHLPQVFRSPALLLYSSGSGQSALCGALLAGGWMSWKVAGAANRWEAGDVIAVAGLFTLAAYNALFKDYGATVTEWWGWEGGEYRYHPLNIYRLLLLLPLLVWVLVRWRALKSGAIFGPAVLWIGIVHTLTTFVDHQTGALVLGLTPAQWAGIGLAACGWVFTVLGGRKAVRQ